MESNPILSIPSLLKDRVQATPDSTALLAPGREPLSYAALHAAAASIAAALAARGIQAQERVAIVLPNGPEMALAFLGVASLASAAPLNPAYKASEFRYYLADVQARALLAPAGEHPCREAAAELGIPVFEFAELRASPDNFSEPAMPSAEALVLHTSGTTSRPKLVPLTQANLCHSAWNVAATLHLKPDDRCLNVMPLFHIHGIVAALLASLRAGGSLVATHGYETSRFVPWLTEFQPTWYTAVPTIHQAVVGGLRAELAARNGTSLRFIRSSSSALPPPVMAELESVFGVPVVEAYGMTEAAHQMACNPLPPGVRKPGSVGPAAGPELAVMDDYGTLLGRGQEGEVVIRGANVTAGYAANALANSQAFTNGWFRTGDLGYLDEDHYVFLTGRLKEIINRGGEKIAPKEIDNCLLEHPGVAEAVCFAVPHTSLGQDVAAAVVLREDATASCAELRRFVASRLAPFKVPARILLVSEIPKGPTGKIQRIGLAEQLGMLSPATGQRATRGEPTTPRNPTEEKLAAIWADVLNISGVGVHDHWSELGGDSLLAATMISQVSASFEVVPQDLVFDEVPTVAEMADHLAAVRQRGESGMERTEGVIGATPELLGPS